jgi:HSP90 family molecular chaperone
VQGVVDSEDIPLNISRENMQDSALIARIASVLTKKMIKFIDTEARKDAAKYATWFAEFGQFVKEGVCTDYQHKDTIAKLLRFETSVSVKDDKAATPQCSLDDYISRMPLEQNNIYYLTAPSRSFAQSSPYFENFEKKGVEVLFLYQSIDDFVMKNLGTYSKRQLVSVESANIEELQRESGDTEKSGEGGKSKKTDAGIGDKDAELEFCGWLKTALKDTCSSVKVSQRLVNTPAIIVDHESAAMRRMMKYVNQGQEDAPIPKQKMEINVGHPIIKKLASIRDSNPAVATTVAAQVFDNALIAADILDNPRTMLGRLNSILDTTLQQAVDAAPTVAEAEVTETKK